MRVEEELEPMRPGVRDEPDRIQHPVRTLVLIVTAMVVLIGGGFGLRHMAMSHPVLPPVQGR
jgi:hypothetical protein